MQPQPFLSRGFPSWQLWGVQRNTLLAFRPPPTTPTGSGHRDLSPDPRLGSPTPITFREEACLANRATQKQPQNPNAPSAS